MNIRLSFIFVVLLTAGCANQSRIGMVQDPATGLQLGSMVERNIFIDPSQFANKTVKIVTRNISGDQTYQLGSFTGGLKSALANKGYIPTEADTFGIKVDLNVLYSGQIQSNMAGQYSFLGGAAGGIAGYRSGSTAGTATGMLVGATVGAILGSHVTQDTYIVIAEVSIGVTDTIDGSSGDKKTITFGSSPKMQEELSPRNFKHFREVLKTKVAVYAGGANTPQYMIAEQVKHRLISIVSDVI